MKFTKNKAGEISLKIKGASKKIINKVFFSDNTSGFWILVFIKKDNCEHISSDNTEVLK